MKIGKYKVTAKLGQGSFGVVYRGRDAYLKRDVAIKVCSVDHEGLRQRFFREAEISGKLIHKNIVTVYEFGFEGKVPYLVQELLSGEDLSPIIKRRAPLTPAVKLDYLTQVAQGLGYAHTEGVIHRDIKPGNIRVLEDGRVKIMDFGIAKLASAETQLTQKGVTMGTASYLPPEQVRGGDLDHRADVFSFGVLAYELLTYERPFRGSTLSALVYQILYKIPQRIVEVWPECPAPLSQLIAKCLEKKPERRFGSFGELLAELSKLREEAAGGLWPALEKAPDPPLGTATVPLAVDEPREPSDVLSATKISQTARGVMEGKVGDFTISTEVSAQEILRPAAEAGAGDSTRPIAAQPAEPPPTDAVPARSSPDAAPPAHEPPKSELPSDRAGGSEAKTIDVGLKTRVIPALPATADPSVTDLTLKAREIGKLVEEGKLEAAKEQLEATISRQDVTSVSTRQATTRLEQPPEEQPPDRLQPARMQTELAGAPPAHRPMPPPTPRSVSEPAAGAPVPATTLPVSTDANAGSDTYRTMIGLSLDRWKWVGVAAAVVLIVAGALWAGLSGDRPAVEPDAEALLAPPPAEVATVAPEPVLGGAIINAVPWGEITEITDAQGYVQELPDEPRTPLYLELPLGTYKIHLRDSTGEEISTCDLEVKTDSVASCLSAFTQRSVTEYFKESGWW